MKVNPKVVSDQFDDEIVVVNLESGCYFSFKSTALTIWKMIGEGFTRQMIIASFIDLALDEEQKINQFVDSLIEEKLIVESSDNGAIEASPEVKFEDLTYAKFDDMTDLIMIDPIHDVDDNKGWPHKPL